MIDTSKSIAAAVGWFPDYWAAKKRADELAARIAAGHTADDETEQLTHACEEADGIAAAVGDIVMAICQERSKYREPGPVLTQVVDELELEDWMKYKYEHGGCADLCTYEQYKAGYKAMKQQQQKDRRCCE